MRKKVIYLLNINDFAPEVCSLTYPYIKQFAYKIKAEICMITERKFPDWPVTYEKLQIYELAQGNGAEWNIYIDSDALIHPECIDFTNFLPKDTVLHNGHDMANLRWTFDRFFWRDGRAIGSCNWFTIASDWCVELWHPLEDLTLEQALANIHPTADEKRNNITAEHLIDDYALSRNIAKYGLKFEEIVKLLPKVGLQGSGFFHHTYTDTPERKIQLIQKCIKDWGI